MLRENLLVAKVPMDWPCSLHDFAVSDNYAVFYLSPYILD